MQRAGHFFRLMSQLRFTAPTNPMRRDGKSRRLLPLILLGVLLSARTPVALAQSAKFPATPAGDMVRLAVDHELNAANGLPPYMFVMHKQTLHGSNAKLFVPTKDAMAGRVIAYDGKPLTPDQRQAEDARVERFLHDPVELREKQRQEKENSSRASRIIKALPDAFIYEYSGFEPGTASVGRKGDELLRLNFSPNPKYDPPSRVEQALTGMQGTLLLDVKRMRIARIEGTLRSDVGFGWGILGHLDKGGHIVLEQSDIGDGTWTMTRLSMRFSGKVLLFKNIKVDTTEVSQDFQRVPSDLTFAQGLELLKKQELLLARSTPGQQ